MRSISPGWILTAIHVGGQIRTRLEKQDVGGLPPAEDFVEDRLHRAAVFLAAPHGNLPSSRRQPAVTAGVGDVSVIRVQVEGVADAVAVLPSEATAVGGAAPGIGGGLGPGPAGLEV